MSWLSKCRLQELPPDAATFIKPIFADCLITVISFPIDIGFASEILPSTVDAFVASGFGIRSLSVNETPDYVLVTTTLQMVVSDSMNMGHNADIQK